ncbi:MAG: selenide, water dikinase SelD [Gammaproteobacteria bacterium]|nr:selenide, water dikinase SelD [Gammaproteobacteria bacterium]
MTNDNNNKTASVKMTEYSHGSGCGCKISPRLLDNILQTSQQIFEDPRLLVGNQSKDDAAVYDLQNGTSVISTTDFFMPIVDDPFEFGQIAATNAISDIYAMGGSPLMAIAIFGWPIDKLGPEIARQVIDGGRHACKLAGIPLAGGHSIDSPEPIFGLAVTGQVENQYLKRNDQATAGSQLFLTKPIGIGILTTALKKKKLKAEHSQLASETMRLLNKAGAEFSKLPTVSAMTDVTGFGLLGHLTEICEGSGVRAQLKYDAVPKLDDIEYYVAEGCSPGGAQRNFDSYGEKIGPMTELQQQILCDPQTSGGLLIAVEKEGLAAFHQLAQSLGLELDCIGELTDNQTQHLIEVI